MASVIARGGLETPRAVARGGTQGELSSRRIGVRCAGVAPWLLLPADIMVQVSISPLVARLPQAPVWLRGVLNYRGGLHPILDVGAWAGKPVVPVDAGCLVMIDMGKKQRVALTCTSAPGIASIGTCRHRLSWPDPLAPFLEGEYDTTEGAATEFDVVRWLIHIGLDMARD